MKKNSEKGFILAETVVTAVFILGIFTFLIMNILPLVSKYEKVLNYDNPEDIYSSNLFVDALSEETRKIVESSEKTETFKEFMIKKLNTTNPTFYILNDDSPDDLCYTDYCKHLIKEKYLNITHVLFFKGDTEKSTINAKDNVTRGMKEYARYFINHLSNTEKVSSNIAVLIRFGNGNYASLWLR